MSIKAVLFDLDGTLLPMDQEIFTKAYFKTICTNLAQYGYDPAKLIDSIWIGTAAMIKNNGINTNEKVFFEAYAKSYNDTDVDKSKCLFNTFYCTKFDDVKTSCGFNPDAAKTIKELHNMNIKTVLATNPIFPAVAVEHRIHWAGIEPSDFEFYTSYENCSYSKPNLCYYKVIADKLNINPTECIMVGNDVSDDMSAHKLGMNVFLITDCLINKDNEDISQYPHGSFKELMSYITLQNS